MSLNRAKKYLEQFKKDNSIIILNEKTATVSEAAHALFVTENQIAKTLSFDLENKYILVIAAGSFKIDNHKFKETFGKRPTMIQKENVEKIVGHEVGGVCPFGINEGIEVYIDKSLEKYDYVYSGCGEDNAVIGLTPTELFEISKAIKYVDVCKESTNEG